MDLIDTTTACEGSPTSFFFTGARPQVAAVVLSGGTGSRLGAADGKQLLQVAGRPLMSWCIEAFDKAVLIDHIVVVCPADRLEQMRCEAIEPLNLSTPVSFAVSGDTRQASELAGIEAVPQSCSYVAIHDGARPLIAAEAVDNAIGNLLAHNDWDGVVFGQPSIDTLKLVDAQGVIESTPDRSLYWTVQTPQIFKRSVMIAAQESAAREGFLGTDDSSLVERAGGKVVCFKSSRDNIKVTVPEDLDLVEALLKARLR